MPRFHRRSTLLAPKGELPFEKTAFDYAHNLLVGTSLRSLKREVIRNLDSCSLLVGLAEKCGTLACELDGDEDDLPSVQSLRRLLRRYVRDNSEPRKARGPRAEISKNLRLLGELVGFDSTQLGIFQFLLVLNNHPSLKELTETFGELTMAAAGEIIAAATNLPEVEVHQALLKQSRLINSGLIEANEDDACELAHKLKLKSGLLDVLLSPGLDHQRLVTRFLPEAKPSTLELADFSHLAGEVALCRSLLG